MGMYDVTLTPQGEDDPYANSGVDISGDEPSIVPSDPVLTKRAGKYDFALGEQSPGSEDILTNLRAGLEDTMRQSVSSQEEYKNQRAKIQIFSELAAAKKGPLTPEEVALIDGIQNISRVDPNSIMEHMYGRQVMNSVLQQDMMKNVIDGWTGYKPEAVLDASSWGSHAIATSEVFRKLAEDVTAKHEKLGWGESTWNLAQTLVPFFSAARVDVAGRQAGVGDGPGAVMPGAIMTDIIQQILALPPDQAGVKAREVSDALWAKNPNDAKMFVDALVSYSSNRAFADDIWAGVDVATLFGSGLGRKTAAFQMMGKDDIIRMRVNARLMGLQAREDAWKAASAVPHLPWDARSLENVVRWGDHKGYIRTIDPLNDKDLNELLARIHGKEAVIGPEATMSGKSSVSSVETGASVKKGETTTKITGTRPTNPEVDAYKRAIDQSEKELEKVKKVDPEQATRLQDHINGLKDKVAAAEKGGPKTDAIYPSDRSLVAKISGSELNKLESTFAEVQKAVSDVVESTIHPRAIPEKVLFTLGEFEKGAVIATSREVKNVMEGKLPKDIQTFEDQLPAPLRADRMTSNPGHFGNTFLSKFSEEFTANWAKLTATIAPNSAGHARVARLPPEALKVAMDNTVERMKQTYEHPSGAYITHLRVYATENTEGVNRVSMVLGTPETKPFTSMDQANFYGRVRYKLGEGNYQPFKEGAGWYLKVTDPVDETTDMVRDYFLATKAANTPVTILNRFLGHLRTSQDVTSQLDREARNIVTHGAQFLNAAIKDVATAIGKLSKEESNNMRTFFQRDNIAKRFYNTVGDFETEYASQFKRLPSEKEVKAYFGYRQLNDFDYHIRNLGFQRDLERMGVKEHRIRTIVPETDKEPRKDQLYSPYFIGRFADKLPTGGKGYGLAFFDSDTGVWSYHRVGGGARQALSQENMRLIDGSIQKDGYKILQVANPLERPLHDFAQNHGGDIINFVVAKDVSHRPVSPNMIPYQPGGHVEYATQHFVKQPIISRAGGRYNYEGDTTLFGFHTEAEARKYSGALNEAVKIMKTGDELGLKVFLDKNLPQEFTYGRFQKYFKDHGGQWNADEPFHYVPSGKSVLEADPKLPHRYADLGWTDEHNSPYNLFQHVDKKFIGSRDPALWTIKELGSEQQPLFKLADADRIDPYVSLNRTVTNAAHERLISDYKYLSVQGWAEQFASVIGKAGDFDQIRRNPLYFLHHPQWQGGINDAMLATAKDARAAILNFIGMDSPDVQAMRYIQNKMLNGIYNKGGQGKSDWFAEHTLSAQTDPTKYARGIAFHSKLGLFNPAQYFNQAQALLHSWALAGPATALKATPAAFLMQGLRYTENPAHLEHFAKMATKLGWAKEDFIESYKQLKRSGWDLVQGETGWKNDMEFKLFKGVTGKILDAGTIFFQEGERTSRLTAWNSSFLEWRKKNPGALFDDRAMSTVLARADLMNLNMTRSSLSNVQTGLGALPMQFWTYQKHLMEQMLNFGSSARLTWQEKARVLGTYSAMYGIPVGTLGTAFGAWPMNDSIRQYALENNIDVNTNTFKLLVQGIPAWMVSTVFGHDYNFPQKGPQGIEALRDFWYGDKQMHDLAIGVAGQTVKDIGKYLLPVSRDMYDWVFGSGDGARLVMQDGINLSRNISSVNNTLKSIYMWNYGKLYTRGDSPVMDADKFDAINLSVFGLTRQEAIDTYLMQDSMKHLDASKKNAEVWIKQDMRSALTAAGSGDAEGAQVYMNRAQAAAAAANFRPDEAQKLHREVMTEPGNVDLQSKVRWDFFVRKAPPNRVDKIGQ